MARSYRIYDVFTGRALAGNPLAVVYDSDGLSDAAMQQIAREFNLSETVFIHPPETPGHAASLRIFTPGRELPFAGHPTVGAAIAIAEKAHGSATISMVSVLEERVGPVRSAIRLAEGEVSFAEFDLPRRSVQMGAAPPREALADALGIRSTEIGFENHVPSLWSAGVPYLLVPIHDTGVAERIEFDAALWEKAAPFADGQLASAYVYCRGGIHHAAKFHARMFTADMGIAEDPATGSAVAALSGAIHRFDALPDGHHACLIEQGTEMGRPSLIHLHIDAQNGEVSNARIGGEAVRIAEGVLFC
nr:PhzF family phenazine biosynthesis protein [uncultured Gellertiella sp.]